MAEAASVPRFHLFSTVFGAQLAVCGALRSASPPTLRTGRARGISPQLPRPRARRFSHLGSRELRLQGELPSQYTPPPNWVFGGTTVVYSHACSICAARGSSEPARSQPAANRPRARAASAARARGGIPASGSPRREAARQTRLPGQPPAVRPRRGRRRAGAATNARGGGSRAEGVRGRLHDGWFRSPCLRPRSPPYLS